MEIIEGTYSTFLLQAAGLNVSEWKKENIPHLLGDFWAHTATRRYVLISSNAVQ